MSKIAVIGGGIVGLFTAWYLKNKGATVTVLDKGNLTDGCSFGNAGLIVPSHIIPLASPGTLKKAFKNLIIPRSPMIARISLDPDLIRWYLRFRSASTAKHVHESVPFLHELSLLSKSLYNELKESNELDIPLWHKGLLILYRSRQIGNEVMEEAEIARQAGLEVSALTTSKIHDLENDAKPDISGGVHYKSDDHSEAHALMHTLIKGLEKKDVKLIRHCTVEKIRTVKQKVVGLETSNGYQSYDAVVVTAGFWTSRILQKLNINIALQPGKGYSFKLHTKKTIHYPAILADAHVSVTPLSNGMTLFGGGMEVGYNGTKIRPAGIRQISETVRQFYPSESYHQIPPEQVWQGHRPLSFDGLPYIGKAPGFQNLYVGTGHSMMGVTLAPATGKLLSELIFDDRPSLNLSPYRIDR